jgi:hypothetical protein
MRESTRSSRNLGGVVGIFIANLDIDIDYTFTLVIGQAKESRYLEKQVVKDMHARLETPKTGIRSGDHAVTATGSMSQKSRMRAKVKLDTFPNLEGKAKPTHIIIPRLLVCRRTQDSYHSQHFQGMLFLANLE